MNKQAAIENIKKIRSLIVSAENMEDINFRKILESLIVNGGEDSEYAVIKYMKSIEIRLETRLNIIRSMGYLHLQGFLEPLKRLVESEENIYIKKEAIISISKYNDRRALNILNNALKDLKNTLLLQTINSEISKIKQDNPLLILIPRFINEKDNKKAFNVTLDILKRIVRTEDLYPFTKFLKHREFKIRDASFEILCLKGDLALSKTIFAFFYKRSGEISTIDLDPCDDFYYIIGSLHFYLKRFPELTEGILKDLNSTFLLVADPRIRSVILDIISLNRSENAQKLLEQLYKQHPDFSDQILLLMGKNEKSSDFLFSIYENSTENRETVIQALMKQEPGISYFFNGFDNKPFEEQELIVRNFPFVNNSYYQQFCRKILKSSQYSLKIILFDKIKGKGEFSIKDILLDPEYTNEFLLMEHEYLSTILMLFPINAVKKIIDMIIFQELSVSKTKRFLSLLKTVLPMELVYDFKDSPILNYLANRIVNMNNKELNLLFLSIFSQIKAFKSESIGHLEVALNIFVNQKGGKLDSKEKYEIRKIKENLSNLNLLKKRNDNFERTLNTLLQEDVIDPESLRKIISENPFSAVFYMKKIKKLILHNLEVIDFKKVHSWMNLLVYFPQITVLIKEELGFIQNRFDGLVKRNIINVANRLPRKSRIVLKFASRKIISILIDQFEELIPEIEVVYGETAIFPTDIVLCEKANFREFMKEDRFPTSYIFLFLETISEFNEYKSYNPKFFVEPYSYHRVMRDVLKEIYTINTYVEAST